MKNKFKIQNSKFKIVMTAVFVLFAAVLRAADIYPPQENKYVNDFAGILAATDRATMSEALKGFEQRTGILMGVVTVNRISDYGEGHADIESFAAEVFGVWGMGAKNGGRTILMFVSIGDRKIKIETGDSFGPEYEEKILEIIEKSMVPFFRQGNYGRGIYEGVREVIRKSEKKPLLQGLNLNALLAAAAAGLLAAAAFLLTRKKNTSSRTEKAQKPDEGKKIKTKPAVKTEKSGQPPVIFGGGASGNW